MPLSPEQQLIADNHSANTCIIAGAGSGKTRTIVQLIVNDILAGIPPEQIIAFTFTHKAADELLARVFEAANASLPDTKLDGIFIGTIHSWCLKFLQDQDTFINYTPLDELHLYCLLNRLYDALDIGTLYGGTFPKGVKEFLKDLEVYYNENLDYAAIPDSLKDRIRAFRNILNKNRLLTFGEMIRHAIDSLRQRGPLPTLASLYVDEYQDVNPAQVALIKAMKSASTKLTVVGDDLQCIYNWRGSDVTRILNFSAEFPTTQVFRLNTNYRSDPFIVDFTRQIAETIQVRDRNKILVPGKERTAGRQVFWLIANSEREQAISVADIIEQYFEMGIPAHQMAILLRSVQNSGQPIVEELERRKIPVQCPLLGRGGEFVNHLLIPLFLWLSKDLTKPMNEIEEEELEKEGNTLWAAAQGYTKVTELGFWQAVEDWRAQIDKNDNDAYNIRKLLYAFLGAIDIAVSNDETSLMQSIGLASQIIRSVEEMHRRRIRGLDRRTSRGIVTECYHALQDFQDSFGESTPLITDFNGIIVTTVHQSKGLEWPIVFLPELNRNQFPSRSRKHGTSYPDAIAGRYGTTIEDEKRLFYVAASRAKSKLFLFSNDPAANAHSRFFDDIIASQVLLPYPDRIPATTELSFADEEKGHADESLKIGLADLLTYIECPFQYGLRRVVNIQPAVGDELGFGKGLHELIQRRFAADEDWSDSQLNEEVEKNVSLPYMSEEAETNSKSIIKSRFEILNSLGLFQTNVLTETSIDVYMNNTVVSGKIDGILENQDGSLTILDWKSTIHQELLDRYRKQVQFYTYALRNQGKTVSNAYLIDVGRSSKDKKLHRVEIDISEPVITSFISQIVNAIDMIKIHIYPTASSKATCPICDMRNLCSAKYPLS